MKRLAGLCLLGLSHAAKRHANYDGAVVPDEEFPEERISANVNPADIMTEGRCNPRYSTVPCPGHDPHHRQHHVYNDVYGEKENSSPMLRSGEVEAIPLIDVLEVKGSRGKISFFQAGQPITIHGQNLLSKEIDEFTGRFTDVYLDMVNQPDALDGVNTKILCEYQGLFPASTDDRLICRTPSLTDQLSNIDNPWSNKQFQVRIEHYVSEVNAMVDIEELYGDSVYTGYCWEEQSRCRISTQGSWNHDISQTKFYGNRMINGKSDRFFWTPWIPMAGMAETGDNGFTEETDDMAVRKKRWVDLFEDQRYDNCDFPVDLEVRRISDQITPEEAGLDAAYNNPFYAYWAFNSSQEEGVHWNPVEWELRWYCDRNVMEMVGVYPDQVPGNVTDANVGIATPKLYSSYDDTFLVGECATDFDGLYYPTTLGDGAAGRTNDASNLPNWREFEENSDRARMRCHMQSESNWHGPAKVYVQSDSSPDWYSEADSGSPENDVWNPTNNFDQLYNVYISPAITDYSPKSGPIDGGTELTITGTKFTGAPTVKVGYNDCVVKSQTDTEIVCTVQRADDGQQKCSDTNEYPGAPGMTVEYYTEKHYYNKDWGTGWVPIFNERENHEDYRWTAAAQDGFAQSTPNNYLHNGEWRSESKYTAFTRGFFVAPQSGYYQFICLGQDHHYLYMNRENPSELGMCPIDTRQGYSNPDQWNYFLGEWSHMNISDDYIPSRSNDASYFMAGSQHGSDFDTIYDNQAVSEHVYLNQGQYYSFLGWMTEHANRDFWSIGFMYHGEMNEETGTYELPAVAQPENLPGQYQYEVQEFKITQNQSLETHEITFNEGTTSVDVSMSDNFGNTRSATLDLTQSEEEIAASFDEQMFKVECEYDDGFTAVYEDGYETSSMDAIHGFTEQLRSNKHQAYCGYRDASRYQTVHNWHTPLFDYRNNNEVVLDILNDDYTHLCFAYYGTIDRIYFKINTNRMAGTEWEAVDAILTTPLVSGNGWAHTCIDVKAELFNSADYWYFRKNKLCGGDCEGTTGFAEGQGTIDDMFRKYKIREIQVRDSTCVPVIGNACPVYVDEVKLGFLTSGDGAPISRTIGIAASDAKSVGSVAAVKSATSLQLVFDREQYANTDNTNWDMYHMRLAEHYFPAHRCGWQLNEMSVSTAGASSSRIAGNGEGFQGEITIGSQTFNPNTMGAYHVTEAYLAEFGEEVRTTLVSDCTSEISYTITWQKEQDAVQRDHGFGGLSASPGNQIEELNTGTTVKNGNILVSRVPGNWLRQASKTPQVTLSLDGDAALCMSDNDDCSFAWTSDFQVNELDFDGSTVSFVTEGMWYSEDVVQVQIGEAICDNLVQAGTQWTCDVPADACAGQVHVQVLMRDNLGFATMNTNSNITLDYTVTSYSPSMSSFGGGQLVTVTGSRFCAGRIGGASSINGKQMVEVEVIDSTTVVVSMPEMEGFENGDQQHQACIGDACRNFNYRVNQTPIITAITDDGCSLTGCSVTIAGDKFYGNQGDSILSVGNVAVTVDNWSNSEIVFSTDFMPVGVHAIQILAVGRGWMHGEWSVESKLEVNKVYPEASSLYGGENFEIHGVGFGVNDTDVTVSVAGQDCTISAIQDDRIECSVDTYPYHISLDTSGSQYDANGNLFPNFNPDIVNIVEGQSVQWCWNLNSGINLEIFGVADLADSASAAWKSPRFEDSTSHCYSRMFTTAGTYPYVTDFVDDSFTLQFRGTINVAAASAVSASVVVTVAAQGTFTNAGSNPTSGASPVDSCNSASDAASSNAERAISSTPIITQFSQAGAEFDESDEIVLSFTSTDFAAEACMSVYLNSEVPTNCAIKSLAGNTMTCAISLADAEANALVAFTYYNVIVSVGGSGHAAFDTENSQFYFEPTLSGLSSLVGSVQAYQVITIQGKALGSVAGTIVVQAAPTGSRKRREAPEHIEIPGNPTNSRTGQEMELDARSGYNNLVFIPGSQMDEHVRFEVEFSAGNYLPSPDYHYSVNDTIAFGRYSYSCNEDYCNGYETNDLDVEIPASNLEVLGGDMSLLTVVVEMMSGDMPESFVDDKVLTSWGREVRSFQLTYCDVHTLEAERIVCTLQQHLPYARYRVRGYVAGMGETVQESHWQFRTSAYESVNVAASVSPNGGAKVQVSTYGACVECETQLTIFNMDGTSADNIVSEVPFSAASSDLDYEFTLPALPVGEYQARVGTSYYFSMHAPAFQIMVASNVSSEITGVSFNSNDINSLVGGETATVAGSFPNCGSATLEFNQGNSTITEAAYDCNSNTFTVPSLPAGSYQIKFSDVAAGDSNTFEQDLVFPLIAIGASLDVSPGSLGGGNSLTLQVEGASAGNTVSVCGVPCSVVSVDDSSNPESLVCTTSKLASSADVDCDVVVTDSVTGVHQTLSAAVSMSLNASPVLTAISKNRGGSAGGSTLVLTGSNFQGTPSVNIDGVECIVSASSSSEITCVTEAAAGLYSRGVPQISLDNGLAWYDETNEDLIFAYVDLWSSVFTWGGSALPQAGEIIVVGPGQHLVMDVDTPLLKALVVMGGVFEIDREIAADSITLASEYIIVTQGGHFKVGTEEEPYPCDKQAEILLFGHRRSINLPIFGSKVLAVRSGKLDLHGCRREVPWTMLGETVEAGSDQITLERGVDWRVGDEIAIATTGGRRDQHQSEKRVITAVSDDERTITLDSALEYRHLSVEHTFMSATGEERTLHQKAEVGVLTRNIKFRGNRNTEWDYYIPACAEEHNVGLTEVQSCFEGKHGEEIGSDRFGAQLMVQNIEYAKIEYVEFTHTGQAFGLGRYSIHFHISGDQPESYVRGCGIHETFNRATTIHATNELTIEYNVVYRVMGQTIFIEDGIEINNVIQYNLVINTLPSSSLLNVDQTPTSYWITNPNNIVRHNHAAGCTHFGFWYNPPDNPTGPSFTRSYCPKNEVMGEFFNNTAHTMGVYGMWIFEDYAATMNGLCKWQNPEDWTQAELADNTGNYFMDTFISWGCERGVEFTKGMGLGAKRFLSAGNTESNIAFMQVDGVAAEEDRGAPMVDCISANYLEIEGDDAFNAEWGQGSPNHARAGIELPGSQKSHNIYYVRDIALYNSGNVPGKVAVQGCYHAKPFDCSEHYYFKNTLWGANTQQRTNIEWEHQFQIIDEDGTYLETGSPSILIPRTDIVPAEYCFPADPIKHNYYPATEMGDDVLGSDGLVCAYPEVKMLTVAFFKPDPDSIRGFPAQVTNEHGSAMIPWRFKRNYAKLGWSGFMLADTTNSLEFPGMRVNHTFLEGRLDGLDHGRFVRVQAVIDESIGSMLWGDNVLTRNDTDMTVENEPTMADQSLSYNMATRTGIFHTNDLPAGKEYENVYFSYIAFAGDIPPAPPSDDETINFRTCNWSDASCWAEGVVPVAGDIVLVEVGQTVIVDIAHVEVDYIYVMGNLQFDDSVAMSFKTKGMQVGADAGYQFFWSSGRKRRSVSPVIRSKRQAESENTNATVTIGSEAAPFNCNKEFSFILKGDHTESIGAHDGSLVVGAKSIAVFHGLEVYGCPVATTKASLENSVQAGATSITLTSAPSGWKVGGSIVIAPSGIMYDQYDEVTIDSINGATVSFSPALNFAHSGRADTSQTYSNGAVLDQAAEVIYTTRNVKIASENAVTDADWNYGIGGRVVVNKMSTYDADGNEQEHFGYAQLSNVEFVEMGQLGFSSVLDPRYALTFYRTAGLAGSSRPTLKDSFVRNCAFRDGYWTAVGSFFTDDLEISNNVVFNTLNGGIHVYASDDNTVNNNALIYIRNKQMYFVDQGFSLNNSNADVDGTSRGFHLQNTHTTILTDNAVAGMEVGVGYDVHGETCDTEQEACSSSATFTSGSLSSGNVVHATAHGVQAIKDRSAKCGKVSGFTIYLAHKIGVYVQTNWDTVVIEDIQVFDSPVGILPNIYKPDPKFYLTTMKSVNIRNSLTAGLSNAFDCNLYDNWDSYGKYNWDWFSHMQAASFGDGQNKGKRWHGFSDAQCWNKYNKYPKANPAKISADGGKPTVNCNYCLFDNSFEWESNKCSDEQFSALNSPRSAYDSHGPVQLKSGNSFAGTPVMADRTQFLIPRTSPINPSDCQDMSGDFHRRRMVIDEEGVLSGTGQLSTISSVSEYEWDGNPTYGLGDNRIPFEMYTALDGSQIPLDQIRTHNGAIRNTDCTLNADINGYVCGNSRRYTYLVVESVDEDADTRRLGPLAIRSTADGYLDLINGACDHSCCNGYSCSLRPSLFKLHVACGQEYEIYGSSSLPKHTRFHLPYAAADCKIKIALFTKRQNRVDVYEGDAIMQPTNVARVNSDGSFEYDRPDPTLHIPTVGLGASGDNFLDRTTELLHVVMSGSNIYDFVTASSVVLNLDVVTEIDEEELFDSEDFPTYLAALLGVDPSMIRVMDVVREDSVVRSTSNRKQLTIEIGPPATESASAPVPDVPTTFAPITTNFDVQTTSDIVVTTIITTTEDQSVVLFNQDDVAESVLDSVISGNLQQTLEQDMGLTTDGEVQVQVAPPEEAPVPEWYEINSEMGVPWYVQYGCTEAQYLDGTCDAPVNEETLDLYSDVQQAENELLDQMTSTQNLVVPSHLYIIEQPSDAQLAGGVFHQPIRVGMKDTDGQNMEVVGIASKPWSVEVNFVNSNFDSGSNRVQFNNVATFEVSGDNAGQAVLNGFGIELPDTNITLEISMHYPADNYTIGEVQVTGLTTIGFDENMNCTNDEGMNPDNFAAFDIKELWSGSCSSVCTLPCEGNELNCYSNSCSNSLMSCQNDACVCGDTSAVTEANFADYVDVQCSADSMSVRINKCAVNEVGFGLPQVFMSGMDVNYKAQGRFNCYGDLAFDGDGVDYVWETAFDRCGTVNNSNVFTNVLQGIEGEYSTGQMAYNAFFLEVSCANGEGSVNVVHAGSSMETVDSFVESFEMVGVQQNAVPSRISLVNKVDSTSDVYNFETMVALSGRDMVMQLKKCWLSSSPDASSATAVTTSLIDLGCAASDAVDIIVNGRRKQVHFSVSLANDLAVGQEYIHCNMAACDSADENCEQEC